MAINRNVLAEKQATVLSEDGNTMYATIQMRHGKESEMDKSKFVPAEMGVATDTKKAFMAFGSNQVKEMMFREDSEIEELLGEVREISDKAVEAVESAEASAKQTIQDFTDQMKATIPEDYTDIVKKVDILERTKAPAIYKTASGESLQIEDSADAPLAGLKVYGKSRQVKTTGAQLIPFPVGEELESYDGYVTAISKSTGIEITLKDGFSADISSTSSDIYFAGARTSTDESSYVLQPQIPAGSYHLHIDDTLISNFSFYIIVLRNGSNTTLANGSSQDVNITIEKNDKFRIFIRPKSNVTVGTYTIKPMLNAGSTTLPFEPYSGGQPSPSPNYPHEIEVPGSEGNVEASVMGAQLIPFPVGEESESQDGYVTAISKDDGIEITLESGFKTDSSFSDIYFAGGFKSQEESNYELIPQIPAGQYHLYINDETFAHFTFYIIVWRNGSLTTLHDGKKQESNITVQENDKFRIFIRPKSDVTAGTYTINPMLNSGSDALPWEPYKHKSLIISTSNGLPGIPVDSGGNYTDAGGQQWVCDEVDFKRGKYVQRIEKIVFDGSSDEGWGSEVLENWIRYKIELNPSPLDSDLGRFRSMNTNFKIGNQGATSNTKKVYTIIDNQLWISMNGTETLENFKEYLSSNPMTLYYILSSPVETDLSPEELAAYAALTTYYPTTNITTDSDPEAGIEAEYVVDTKKYIDSKFAELAQNLAATQNTLLEV